MGRYENILERAEEIKNTKQTGAGDAFNRVLRKAEEIKNGKQPPAQPVKIQPVDTRTAAHNNEQRKADRQQRLSAASVSPVKLPTASEGPTLPTFAQATAKSRAAYVQELQRMASRPEAILSQTKKEVDNLNVQIEEAKKKANAAWMNAEEIYRTSATPAQIAAADKASRDAQAELKRLESRRDMLAGQYYAAENEGTLQANEGNTAFQNALQLQTDLQKVQDIVNQRSTMSGEERTAFVQGLAARYGTSNTGKLAQALMQELAPYEEQLKLQNVDVDRVAEFLRRQERTKQAQEVREQRSAAAREMPVAASVASVLASPFQGIDMLKMLGTGSGSTKNLDSYVPYDTNVMTITDAVNTIRQTVSEEIEKNTDWEIAGQNVASFLYNTGMSVADSALMVATLGPGASYLMGLSAAANQSKNIAERGGTNRQALLGGLAAGAAEMIFERVSIEKLLTPKAGDDVWKSMLKQAGVEASEEMATEIANILADAAIMGERSEYKDAVRNYMQQGMTAQQAKQSAFFDLIGQVAGAGIGGALSGGVMSGSAGAVNAIANGGQSGTQNEMRRAEEIASRFGATIKWGSLENGAAGEYKAGEITIDPNAKNPVRQVLIHELTHHMENSGLYEEFSRMMLDYAENSVQVDVADLQRRIIQEYAQGGIVLDEAGAQKELVAKIAESRLFQDEAAIRQLAQTNRNLFQKIYQWIRETITKLKGTQEQQFLVDAQKLYEKALQGVQGTQSDAAAQNLYAGRNARTADLEALTRAKEMENEGADAESIRRETGWNRGKDGKWRFEVDDSGMRLKLTENIPNYLTVGELVDAPQIFAQYPELAEMAVTFQSLPDGAKGQYNRRFDDIDLDYSLKNDPERLLDTLVHELQHATQNREGFAHGASPEYWQRQINRGMDARRANVRREEARLRKELENIREQEPEFYADMMALNEIAPTVPRGAIDWDTLEKIEEDPIEWQTYDARRDALEEKYGDMKVWDFNDLLYNIQRLQTNEGRNARELYRDTAGEIEAYDVQSRRTMSAEERKNTAPNLGGEDVVFAEGEGRYLSEQEAAEDEEILHLKEQIRAHLDELNRMEPVADKKTPTKFPERISERRAWVLSVLPTTEVDRQGFGIINVGSKQIAKGLTYARSDGDIAAFSVLPQVLKKGRMIEGHQNHKGNNIQSVTFAAPVVLNGETGIMAAVVKKTKGNNYSAHKILLPSGEAFVLEETNKQSLDRTVAQPARGRLDGSTNSAYNDIIAGTTGEVNTEKSYGRSFDELVAAQKGTAEAVPKAQAMIEAGEPVYRIMEETGLHQGPDGTLRDKFGNVVYTPEDEVQAESVIEDEEERAYAQMERDAIYGRIDEEGNPVEIPAEQTEREIVEAQKMQQTANAMQPSEAREAIDAFIRGESDVVPASELGMTEKPQESKTIRESVADSAHFIYRKMVDSGEAVSRVAKQAGDPTLYAYYNAARASGNAAVNMIVEAQTNVNGEVVGEALMDIFQPIIDKGERYYSNFQMYLWHRHNQSRMSLEKPESREAAQLAYEDYKQDHPELRRFDDEQIRKIAKYEGPYQAAAQGYVKALDELQRARNVKNKPVFGDDYSAQDSKAIADRLLQENPEFKELAERVYQYEKNLMQYRIDSGLVTQKQADIWAQMYPEYVPTLRDKEAAPAKKKGTAARVSKTVKTAEGGDTGLLPIHVALAAQTRSAVREGSKNRFGQKLLNARDKLGAFMTEVTESDDNIGEVDLDSRETVLDPEQQKNTFTIYKDGKAYTMQISGDLFEGIDTLMPSVEEENIFMKLLSGSNNLFKLSITGYNPLFTIRNAIKDQQAVMINSKNYAQYAKMYPQAVREIAQNGPYWQQYKALGGTTSSVLNYKTDEVEKAKGLGKVMERIEAINLAVEQAPRLAEFMATLQSGDRSTDNLMQAMLNAQDVTTNFGRSGTWGKWLNRYLVPFLNPSIQGTDRFVRSLTERRDFKGWLSLVAKCAIFGFAAPAINGLLYADDDEWDDLKDRDKNTYFLFKIGDGKWLKIHRGREFSAMSFMSALIKDVVSGEQVSVGDYLEEIYNQIGPTNPMDNNLFAAWKGAKLFDPEDPGETWYGGDIESERLQGYAPGDRYDEKTDVVSKWIGGKLNISPKKLNYLIDQYTGVVGDVLLPALSPQAERDMLSSAFTIDSVRSNKYSGEFYDTMDQLEYAKNDPNASGVDKIAYRYWNKQNSIVGDINAAIREIEADPTLSQKEKKEQTRALMATRNAAQAAALGNLEAYTAAAERAYAETSGDEEDRIDEAYREANREIYGAEYAMQTYNKNAYENALPIVQAGVSWDSYYDYYFASRDAKKKSEKRAVINGMDISDEEKQLLYEGAVASEADLENMAQMEASGVEGETVRKIAYEIDGLQPTPGKEDVSAQQKFTAVAGMSGLSDAEKLGAILAYDQTEDASAYADYKAAYDAGLSVKEYDAYRVKASGITSDKDANGKTISGSKKEKVVAAIDAMPITDEQKDFLFLLDYAESGLDDTPWHSDRYAGQLPTAANGFRGQSGGASTNSIRSANSIRGKRNLR